MPNDVLGVVRPFIPAVVLDDNLESPKKSCPKTIFEPNFESYEDHLQRSSFAYQAYVIQKPRYRNFSPSIQSRWGDAPIENVVATVEAIFSNNFQQVFKDRCLDCVRLLKEKPHDGLGKCSNKFRYLDIHECACALFDRLTCSVRSRYEGMVIQSVMDHIRDQYLAKGEFNTHIVFYKPGRFGSETILVSLLTQEIQRLFTQPGQQKEINGVLRLSFIDPYFRGVKDQGSTEDPSFQLAINQFHQVLAALQRRTNVKIAETAFFESLEDYVSEVRDRCFLGYDFFLASDLGGDSPSDFAPAALTTRQSGNSKAMILYGVQEAGVEKVRLWINGREAEMPRGLAQIHPNLARAIPISLPLASSPVQENSRNNNSVSRMGGVRGAEEQDNTAIWIGISVALVLTVAVVIYVKQKKQ